MNDYDSNDNFGETTRRPNGGITGSTGAGFKDKVGQSLETAAGALRNRVTDPNSQNNTLTRLGSETANGLDKVASYVRDADAQKFRRDIEDTIRTNPGRSLIVAGVAGLLLGSLLRRR